jgi:hypothetical protein
VSGGHATISPDDLGKLMLGNDCGPCCDCDSFVNVQRAILNIEARLRSDAALAEKTRDEYIAAVERWNAQKECREGQALQATMVGSDYRFLDISASICNASDKCMVDKDLTITVQVTAPTVWTPAPGQTYMTQTSGTLAPYSPTVVSAAPGKTVLKAYIDATNPYGRTHFRTRVQTPLRVGPGITAIVVVRHDQRNTTTQQQKTVTAQYVFPPTTVPVP